MAISDPGIFFENFGLNAIISTLSTLTAAFPQSTVPKWRK